MRLPVPAGFNGVKPEKLELEVEKWDEKSRSIVSSSRARIQDKESKKKARYWGEFDQRVSRETQSRFKGRQRQSIPQGEGDRAKGLSLRQLLSPSSNPNALGKDIPPGPDTILNTDSFLYASFINRIADEIYDSWVEKVEDVLGKFSQRNRTLEENTYITRVEVLMDKKGEVLGIKTLLASGVTALDQAPKQAFWDNEPFPHPPSQMIGDDQLARFVYEFRFEWQTGFSIIPRFL